jgi:hypothetical protein
VHLDGATRQMHNTLPPLVLQSVATTSRPKEIAVISGISDNLSAFDTATGNRSDSGCHEGWPRIPAQRRVAWRCGPQDPAGDIGGDNDVETLGSFRAGDLPGWFANALDTRTGRGREQRNRRAEQRFGNSASCSVCAQRRDRQGFMDQRQDDQIVRDVGRIVGDQRAALCRYKRCDDLRVRHSDGKAARTAGRRAYFDASASAIACSASGAISA